VRTNPQRLVEILELVKFEGTVVLQSPDFNSKIADLNWKQAKDLAWKGEIEGVGSKGNPIKYLRLLNDDERPAIPPCEMFPDQFRRGESVFKTREPIGSALRAYYEEKCGEYLVPTLCRVSKHGQLLRWNDKQRFNPRRFNPDKLPPFRLAA